MADLRSDEARRYRKLYFTKEWRSLRKWKLADQPLCERCLTRGQVTPATVVHHKRPHRGDRVLFFSKDNLASSCAPCHNIDEQRIEKGNNPRHPVSHDGWPLTLKIK